MKISFVSGICKRHDAISEAVLGTIRAATERLHADWRLYAYVCDFEDVRFRKVSSVADILLDRFFLESDVIIYHFGIYYEHFNALLLGNGRARQIVVYHNVTPKELLPISERRIVAKSEQQIANMNVADEIWAVSNVNKRHLEEWGVESQKVRLLPLYIKPRFAALNLFKARPDDVRILYVGRFVESKGVADLIRAVAKARDATMAPFSLDLLGNQTFSDQKYLAKIANLVGELGLRGTVRFVGEVCDEELERYLAHAAIFATASYHEGFCVPLIEAMNAGCVPIAYGAGNIPELVQEFGELIEPGNWEALGEGIAKLVNLFSENWVLADSMEVELGGQRRTLRVFNDGLAAHLKKFTFKAFGDNFTELIKGFT